MTSREELEAVIERALNETPAWPDVLRLVRQVSGGNIYLVGGFVYRNLLRHLYGTPVKNDVDFDFVVEARNDVMPGPDWTETATKFGGPRFHKEGIVVDVWSFAECRGFESAPKPFTIESYCACVTLSVQAIAYDLEAQRLFGDAGLASIRTRTLAPHCFRCLEQTCAYHGITRDVYLRKKAAKLQFTVAERLPACA